MYILTIKYRSGRRKRTRYESKHDLLQTIKLITDHVFTDAYTVTEDNNEYYMEGTKEKDGTFTSRVKKIGSVTTKH